MTAALSSRLLAIVDALPLRDGIAILEIGCGPGAMAREIAARIGRGRVLAIDRSSKAIAQARAGLVSYKGAASLEFRQAAIEEFTLEPGDAKFDLAVAIRVGVLDGRHPEKERDALARISNALAAGGKLYIDGVDPLIEKPLNV